MSNGNLPGQKLFSISAKDVEFIGKNAFLGCDLEQGINFPSVKTISGYAFYGSWCMAPSDNFPLAASFPLAKDIGECAFANCSFLENIYLPEVETIGDCAFSGCPLTHIVLPKIRTIGKHAFDKSVDIDKMFNNKS
jgi:hypothetical protein